MDRLAMLQQFVAQRPDDPFARYGLAMELKKRGLLGEEQGLAGLGVELAELVHLGFEPGLGLLLPGDHVRGLLAQANAVFVELMSRHPEYVPAYLMAGNNLLADGDRDGAREVFTRGVAAAERAGDDHALGELEAARAALD